MRLAVLLAASLACVGIGFAKSAALSAHVKDLETLQKIIQYLRGEIVTAASPLPDAFWETGRRMRDPYRDFLQDISEDMRRPDGKSCIYSERMCLARERLSGFVISSVWCAWRS